ncbi:hypothetical protein Btru_049760 [Bulinus truncatus]|nr:hypothetical protein Btru_049760 [Bulinus truncatus]
MSAYDDSRIKVFLEIIISLGKAAEEDYLHFEANNTDIKEVVSEQNSLQSQNNKVSESCLEKDQSRQKFEICFQNSKECLQNLKKNLKKFEDDCILTEHLVDFESVCEKSANEAFDYLIELQDSLTKMMTTYRKHEALVHTKTAIDVNREEDMKNFQDLFIQVFHLSPIEYNSSRLGNLRDQLNFSLSSFKADASKLAWCFDKQPLPCIKLNTSTRTTEDIDIQLRLFGISKGQIKSEELCYFFEKNHKKKSGCKIIRQQVYEETESGLIITVTLQLHEFERSSKRSKGNDFEHFNRILWKIQLNAFDLSELRCFSLPFTARTGSPQLWYYTGAVDWYCWVEEDLYNQAFHCSKTMELKCFLSWLQEKYFTITSKCFTKDNIQSLITVLEAMPKRNGEIRMNEILQGKLPPLRHSKTTIERNFSFYTWYIAACNTLIKFKEDEKLGVFVSFMTYRQTSEIMNNLPMGSTLVRISQSCIKNEQSEKPYADVAIHIATGPNHQIAKVEEADSIEDLCSLLSSLKINVKDEILPVHRLFPKGMFLSEYQELSKEKNIERKVNTDGYGTRFRENQGDKIIEFTENTNLDKCPVTNCAEMHQKEGSSLGDNSSHCTEMNVLPPKQFRPHCKSDTRFHCFHQLHCETETLSSLSDDISNSVTSRYESLLLDDLTSSLPDDIPNSLQDLSPYLYENCENNAQKNIKFL